MSNDERITAELDAMGKLAALLEPLEIVTRERVLKWGTETLAREVRVAMTAGAVEALKAELDTLLEQAKQIGVEPRVLANAYAAGDDVREAVAEKAKEAQQ